MTKIVDVRAKSTDELGELLITLRREQFNLRFQRATGQEAAVSRIKVVRRDIARVKTIMAERVRAAAPATRTRGTSAAGAAA